MINDEEIIARPKVPDNEQQTQSVLVVDDNDVGRKILSAYIKDLGHQVVETSGGEQALQEIKRNKIDMIFVDLHMPDMNGAETAQRIRQTDEYYKHIPIIGLSADNNPESLRLGLSSGMDEFLCKPINQSDIKNIIQRLRKTDYPSFSNNLLQNSDVQSLRSLLIAELPGYRISLEESCATGDHECLYQTAHKIVGGSIYCEIPLLEEAARALQSVAKGNNQSVIQSQTQRLLEVIDSTLKDYQ